jgi:hypothetical protein
MFKSCTQRENPPALHYLATLVMSVPAAMIFSAGNALNKEHKQKVADEIKAKVDADLAKQLEETPLAGYELYYQDKWSFHNMSNTMLREEILLRPLDSCELDYQKEWCYYYMSNARLRQEKVYVPDPSSCTC